MVEVFDLHQAEHKTIHHPAKIVDFNPPNMGWGARRENILWVPAKIGDFCGYIVAGWSSGSSSGS
jgi:hypothetical protein